MGKAGVPKQTVEMLNLIDSFCSTPYISCTYTWIVYLRLSSEQGSFNLQKLRANVTAKTTMYFWVGRRDDSCLENRKRYFCTPYLYYVLL